jgi:hypothetical protein
LSVTDLYLDVSITTYHHWNKFPVRTEKIMKDASLLVNTSFIADNTCQIVTR